MITDKTECSACIAADILPFDRVRPSRQYDGLQQPGVVVEADRELWGVGVRHFICAVRCDDGEVVPFMHCDLEKVP